MKLVKFKNVDLRMLERLILEQRLSFNHQVTSKLFVSMKLMNTVLGFETELFYSKYCGGNFYSIK